MNVALQPPKSLGFKKAIDLMHRRGTRLVKMHTNNSPEGFAHYVIPGGYVDPSVAKKIKDHPGVIACDDGLFPKHDQTWKMNVNEL